MKNHNKKMPLQTLTGQSGKYQTNGGNNHTLSKGLKVLSWIYDWTAQGLNCTAFDSFKHNSDTIFTTRVSILCRKYGLEIPRSYVKNSNTGTWHKKYWLSNNDIIKVKKILGKEVNNG